MTHSSYEMIRQTFSFSFFLLHAFLSEEPSEALKKEISIERKISKKVKYRFEKNAFQVCFCLFTSFMRVNERLLLKSVKILSTLILWIGRTLTQRKSCVFVEIYFAYGGFSHPATGKPAQLNWSTVLLKFTQSC